LCSSLRISGQLPAPIVNGGGGRLGKVQFSEPPTPRDLDIGLGSGHTACRRASPIDIHLHTKFHWNQKNFLWTDGRMDVPTDGHFRPPLMLLGRLGGVDLKGGIATAYGQFNRIRQVAPMCTPHLIRPFLGRTRDHSPSDISIGSAILAPLTADCSYTLQRAVPFPSKLPLRRGSGPHLIHGSLVHPYP